MLISIFTHSTLELILKILRVPYPPMISVPVILSVQWYVVNHVIDS